MKILKNTIITLIVLTSFFAFSQERPDFKKVKVFGKVVEKTTNQPLEYATVTLVNTKNAKAVFGGITNNLGQFSIDANAGLYDVKVEFIAFNSLLIKQQKFFEDTNLGTYSLIENPSQLNEVVVRAETSTVEIKLAKKVYNVGKDMIVKGGSASDVLNNVPSVTVDSDGNVSLRGNENVKIFIDGRPSTAANITTALQAISADSVDKVEVISNPSARYDAEGGAGILNIVLKKGKTNGLNGTVTATVGNPKNYGLQAGMNFKTEKFNFFSSLGIIDSRALGNGLTNSDYLDAFGNITESINERSKREMAKKGHNFNFGIDLNLDNSTVWSNALNYRKNDGAEPNLVLLYYYESAGNSINNRFTDQNNNSQNIEYNTNFTKKFKKDGHKLVLNFTISKDVDNDTSIISDYKIGNENNVNKVSSKNLQKQSKNVLQADYILPLNKSSQLEMGYKGDFGKLITDYAVGGLDAFNNYTPNSLLTNVFGYNENVNAAYVQFGSKYKKFSYLTGLRFEDTNIDINFLSTNLSKNKQYQRFFPSVFLTYPITESTSLSLNYSRRISRPRNRFINPFAGISSNVNVFQGNPDINPSFTDAVDFGVLTKINKVTVTSSLYYNKTTDPFQFIRRPNGEVVNGAKVLLSTPINLQNENRFGIELTANFSPYKWWKINSNFNFFKSQISGDYSYTLLNSNILVNNSYDKISTNWFVKLNSKISLPYKIDWQANGIYTAPQNTVQGQSLGVYVINMAFSKDVLKDNATISLNVSDLFNTQKMIRQFNLPDVNSYSEMQRRERQINLSFTYRFNKKKSEERPTKLTNEGGGDF
jgi:outer membrane receptor for ferrienterochelin and colicins